MRSIRLFLPVALVGCLSLLATASASAATFTVSNTNDSGPGSLRDAINQANAAGDADVIKVPAGRWTIVGNGDDGNASGDYDILQPVTIDGAGADKTIIDGAGNDRIFQILTTGAVRLTAMQVTGGSALAGAGIYSATPQLSLDGMNISKNVGGNGAVGGGVFGLPATDANYSITSTKIEDNRAGGSGGSGTGGGLIINGGAPNLTLTVENSSISRNTVGGNGDSGVAGGLYASGTTSLIASIKNSHLDGNRAGGGVGGTGTIAGTLLTSGAGDSHLVIQNSTLNGNVAGGSGATGTGASLYFAPAGASTVDMSDSQFNDNRTGGGANTGTGLGGGPMLSSGAAMSTSLTRISADRNVTGGSGATGTVAGVYVTAAAGSSFRLTESSISDNSAGGGAATGGGVATGLLLQGPITSTIERSTIAGNLAGGGGANTASGAGMYTLLAPAELDVNNTTISGNKAQGAITAAGGGGLFNNGATRFLNSTIDGNSALESGTAVGGGLYIALGSSSLKNTIVSNNTAVNGPGCFNVGAITTLGHNIDSGDSCSLGAAGDLKNTNPQLSALAANGGPTKTLALKKGSPAINAGDNSGCPSTDQRGGARPQPPGGICDIGAYEYGALADLVATSTPKPDPANASHPVTYTLKLTNAGPSPDDATGLKLADTLPSGVKFKSVKTSQGTCTGKGPVNCTIGTLASGASATVTLVVNTKKAVVATNTATLSGDPTEANAGNNVAKTVTNVRVALDNFKLSPKSFAAGAVAEISRSSRPTVSYKLSQKATVSFKIQKPARGRKGADGKCGKSTKSNRKGKRCTYYKTVRSFSRKSKAGKNRFAFKSRVKRLKSGKYRLEAVAKHKNKALNSGAKHASFKLKR